MLEGDLTDFTLPDVLRLLAFTTKTGRLTLEDTHRAGRVDLVDGRVRDASAEAGRLPLARRVLGTGAADGDTVLGVLARYQTLPTDLELARALVTDGGIDAGTLAQLLREQTVDAVFDLLRWPAGSFRFTADTDGAGDGAVLDLAVPVDELLDEATRRLAAFAALEARTGPLEAVVALRRPDAREGGEVELPPEGWRLLTMVDGRRTVAELISLSGQGEQRTRQTLGALVDEGVVEVGADADGGPLERLLRDHAALAEREERLAGIARAPEPATAPTAEPATAPTAEAASAPMVEPATAAGSETDAASGGIAPADAVPPPPPAPSAAPAEVAPAEAAPRQVAPDEGDLPTAAGDDEPQRLRTRVRSDRLRTDPSVDDDLVSRLIEGVENL